ncbi:hypothetical protein HGP29_22450 [Flammeovirga sp. SR4]|uniref:Uncharacterized protein n=1 Tax=Flammeovirga agarivorans TaxID=2726742 RepID=A0A7X8XY87_9BACT|nr:hypothetical protein [Flammeovirga sp. SubArs3]NLR93979.1 hypothetical protein [Flammeovirga agarivorans]
MRAIRAFSSLIFPNSYVFIVLAIITMVFGLLLGTISILHHFSWITIVSTIATVFGALVFGVFGLISPVFKIFD